MSFKILNLPNDIYVEIVKRSDLRKVMNSIWYEVFPERTELQTEQVSTEREFARKKTLNNFND